MSSNKMSSEKQKTTTAIIALASDIGSIFSIVNASDFNPDIYNQTKILNEEICKIGYKAEKEIFDAIEIKKMAEHLSKLTNAIYRKKEFNPLISDELISALKKTECDAENVVKLVNLISQ